MSKIELLNGKYTVIHDNRRGLHALRYGEEWRNLIGDNLVMAMANEIEELQEKVDSHEEMLDVALDIISELHYEDEYREIYEYLYGGDMNE